MILDEGQPFLFVGLGNPGLRYALTRHNMGYLVVEALAEKLGLQLEEDRRFDARAAKGIVEGVKIHLVLPLTYMNLSGNAVLRYASFFKISIGRLVVVTDDVALPFGQLRLRTKGSAGGHNGLKSIQNCLGSSEYKRLRLGIGHPGEKGLVNYVLERFSDDELRELPALISQGACILHRMLKESFSHVMKSVNTVPPVPKTQVNNDLTKPPANGRGE